MQLQAYLVSIVKQQIAKFSVTVILGAKTVML